LYVRRSSHAFAFVTAFATVLVPATAQADQAFRGIGQALGLAAGGATAIVVAPIGGAVAAASDSRNVSFIPATGVALGAGIAGALAGTGLAALDSDGSGADVALPPVMAGVFALAGAFAYWLLAAPAQPRPTPTSRLRIVPTGAGISGTF
jgi:hypothetical protein